MIPWLDPSKPPYFPDTRDAMEEPRGLLAAGGKLSVDWLLVAYRQGIFPWFSHDEPILWWSPAPRVVLLPENFHQSKSLIKLSRKKRYLLTHNQDFKAVIERCAAPRANQSDTWIVDEMIEAYIKMHQSGFAHSWECWDQNNELVGGLYGVALGKVFFGESMFSLETDTSKLCLKSLVESGAYQLIDCQLPTDHLTSLGATQMDRNDFESMLNNFTTK
ncbi:MAG: leucyl/phenylalanyl-tRNA--protein transferase [Gammaproteobacteria bacterium]|nr:MAG: leucyl/phenylalanyl-tRNA--protein transferase [Gammaproteobacteria bacterium]